MSHVDLMSLKIKSFRTTTYRSGEFESLLVFRVHAPNLRSNNAFASGAKREQTASRAEHAGTRAE